MAAPSTAVKQTEEELEPLDHERALKEEEIRAEIEEAIQVFGGGLQSKFDKQVGLKEEIEQRWLDDLRHYNGHYDKETEADLNTPDKERASKIFVNLTRAKCNTAESKWSDLVLPTDDRNWGIKPTPVPTLADALTDESKLVLTDGSEPVDPETGEPYRMRDLAEETIEAATKASDKMELEMDDQLTECRYNATCREIIHDAVVMGSGILKGPMIERRVRKAWVMQKPGEWVMNMEEDIKPSAANVDPWNYFPDMSATKKEDVEFEFERHLLTKKQLRKLANQPGFMANQVAKVLMNAPNAQNSKLSHINELRQLSGITSIQHDNRYEVLEYHGPVDKEDLMACGCKGLDLENPLEEYEGVVWICMGIVIKIGLNHLDSDESMYSVLNWERDDTSVFGFGVPYRMRSPQKVMNASWRMVLDNAGLSTGPQLLINKNMVSPADRKWELSPRKIWWLDTKDPKFRADYAMQSFNIDNRQGDLISIFELAHRLADEETSVPQLQMGNQSGDTQQPAMLKTLGGTALWMSSMNIMMRRAVKNFDDQITVPFLTRLYDWNMQFNKKPEIKGDFSVDARGTSVLLVREMQARNVQEFISAALAIPGGADELKPRKVLKNMAKGMQIATDDVLRTDEEAKAAENDPPPIPPEVQREQMKIQWEREREQMRLQIAMIEAEGQRQEAMIAREVKLMELAAGNEVKLEQIRQTAGIQKYKIDWDIQAFYEEMKLKMARGDEANYGLNEAPNG